MSHELTIREDGKVEMAFREGTSFPWHFNETNPTQVPVTATTDEWVHAAGMEWTVERAPLRFTIGKKTLPLTSKEALYRSDTHVPLGVVSPEYKIVQPRDTIEFFDDLIQVVGLKLDTAGTMFGGKRFWALAKIDEQALTRKTDVFKGYLLLTTSADGSTTTEARFTSVRVVCNNTLTMAMAGKSAGSVKMSHRSAWSPDRVKAALGIAPTTFNEFMASMRKLADHRLDDDAAQVQVKKTLGKVDKADGKEGVIFARTMDLFRGLATGADLPGVKGTAYGLLNAFTETLDHKSKAVSDSHRLNSALMGPGESMKIAFRDQLMELVS
jgi:phage/plasmid-like protein (TIGR03299 family)